MKILDWAKENKKSLRLGVERRGESSLRRKPPRVIKKAQDEVVKTFAQILDHRFTMIVGMRLLDLRFPFPQLVLVGPPGVWVFVVCPQQGVFRAVEEQWLEMDARSRNFRPARPNPIGLVRALVEALRQRLSDLDGEEVPVEGAAIFTEPAAHLDLQRPAVRLIPADALRRFASTLLQSEWVIRGDAVLEVIERLKEPIAAVEFDDFSPLPKPEEALRGQPTVSRTSVLAQVSTEPRLVRRLGRLVSFSRRQWLILGALMVLNILILVAVILLAFLLT